MAKASRKTRQTLRTMEFPSCDYCGGLPSARIRPARGASFLVCAEHEERGLTDSGQGKIERL
jgi:hypothetical protein